MTARVVVVGGGVAGLTTAYRLLERGDDLDVTVIEASSDVGGRLRSVPIGDLELDAGPDSFVARKRWAVALCEELGLPMTPPGATGAAVWTDRGLLAVPRSALGIPADVSELVGWKGLSRNGRTRALADLVRKPVPSDDDEALGALLRRRLGDEATDALVAPLLAGLFAGDVDRLGVAATFPELAGWERRFGSLIRGAKAALEGASAAGPMFLRPRAGVGALPRALVERVGRERVIADAPVERVEPRGDGFAVATSAGVVTGNAVVLATPSDIAASTLATSWPDAAARLGEIRWVSTAVVLLVYGEGTADAVPEATGFVVPRERAPMTAATYLSRKWPDPAFGSRAVVRCFVGADGSEEVVDAPDEDVLAAVARHLAAVTGLPERPADATVVRWPKAMPQYEVGHLGRVAAIEGSLPTGIFVVGNAYRGVGVADTIRGANDVAGQVRAHLLGDTGGTEPDR